jgi:phenylpropionate dioxygenase-like ring-hydroxylating dioxygenase large terminal subunit
MRVFPAAEVPEGWFMIGWSHDFAPGQAVPLRYFDTELVAYRGESGTVTVLDAYCRHMGAHLGYGGKVEGDEIRCPYHGWRWSADGHNTDIPYSAPNAMPHLCLRTWPVREVDEIVLVFHSRTAAPPAYEPPDQMIRFDGDTWAVCPETTRVWHDVPISPQYMAENAADAAHFKYVHRSADIAEVAEFEATDGLFAARIDITFGGHAAETWATPTGPVDGYIITENWGLGLGWSRLVGFDDVIFLLGITPITPERCDMRSTAWVAKKRADGSLMDEATRDRWVVQQNQQVDADLVIWSHLSYVRQAPWAKSEAGAMRTLRKWASGFYSQTAD